MISSPVWSTNDPPPMSATYTCGACGFSSGELPSWEDALLAEYRHTFNEHPDPEVDELPNGQLALSL